MTLGSILLAESSVKAPWQPAFFSQLRLQASKLLEVSSSHGPAYPPVGSKRNRNPTAAPAWRSGDSASPDSLARFSRTVCTVTPETTSPFCLSHSANGHAGQVHVGRAADELERDLTSDRPGRPDNATNTERPASTGEPARRLRLRQASEARSTAARAHAARTCRALSQSKPRHPFELARRSWTTWSTRSCRHSPAVCSYPRTSHRCDIMCIGHSDPHTQTKMSIKARSSILVDFPSV